MTYGLYKNVRNSAWQCLIDFNVTYLPTNVIQIARESGIKLIKNSHIGMLAPTELGLSIAKGEQWYIIYNDTDSRQECRFTIAHELGHIFLGHNLKQSKHARTRRFDITRPEEEDEADSFAARILAPACVIWAFGLHEPDDIASLCDISYKSAKKRAKRMEVLYKRDKFFLSRLERKVYKNFEDFIKTKRKRDIVSQYNKSLWG